MIILIRALFNKQTGLKFTPPVIAISNSISICINKHTRELIEEIEKTHREFHEIAFEIERVSSEEEKLKNLKHG